MTCLVRSIGCLAAFALAFAPPTIAADELFGWVFTGQPTDSSRLVIFDPTSGAHTDVGGAVGNCCRVSGNSAIDPAGQRFFFTGNYMTDAFSDPLRLFAISTATGLVVSDAPLPSGVLNALEWDPLAQKLFAVVFVNGKEGLYELNTATGDRALVGPEIAGCCIVAPGASALDFDGNRLFFIGRYHDDPQAVQRIFTFDTLKGTLVANPAPILPGNRNYNFLEWDPSPGTLYALVRDTIRTSEGLTTVNPADGAASPLGSGISVCCGVGQTGSALDPNGDRFYFLGIPGGESNWRLWSVALSTGAGLNKPQLSDAERYNFLELAPSPLPVELTGFTIK